MTRSRQNPSATTAAQGVNTAIRDALEFINETNAAELPKGRALRICLDDEIVQIMEAIDLNAAGNYAATWPRHSKDQLDLINAFTGCATEAGATVADYILLFALPDDAPTPATTGELLPVFERALKAAVDSTAAALSAMFSAALAEAAAAQAPPHRVTALQNMQGTAEAVIQNIQLRPEPTPH